MASYALMVRSPSTQLEAMKNALDRALHLAEQGHHIAQVFFYGPSSLLANKLVEPAANCPDFRSQWLSLSQQFGAPLVACASVGKAYGLIADNTDEFNVADGFSAGGLSEFVALLAEVDHVEQF